MCSFVCSQIEQKKLELLVVCFLESSRTCTLHVQSTLPQENVFQKRKWLSKKYLDVERMDYWRLLKDFAAAHLPVLSACAEKLFGGQFVWKRLTLLLCFAFWAKRNLWSVKNISEWLRLLQSKSPEEHLWDEIQFLRNYVISKLFPDFLQTVYGRMPKIFLLSCRTCFVRVQRNTLRTFFERSITNIITSGLWAKKLFAYGNTFSRVVASAVYFSCRRLVLLCTCAKQHFEDFFRTKYS